jgi:putative transposase
VLCARVSTRRVEGLVATLGIQGLSKSQVSELARSLDGEVAAFRARPLDAGPYPYVWVDALAVKCREQGRIVNVACVLATGVNADGHREILGVDVLTSEDGAGWTGFLRGLVARGLSGVELVIARGGAPGRGSSTSPSNRRATNRDRHLPTVGSDTPSSTATCLLVAPVAQASTIRHRNASAWELLARRDQRVSVWRSSSVKISGALGRPVLAIR